MAQKKRPVPLDAVIDHYGGGATGVLALAAALEIERQAIYMWRGQIPELRAYQIEKLTQGKFSVDYLLGRSAA